MLVRSSFDFWHFYPHLFEPSSHNLTNISFVIYGREICHVGRVVNWRKKLVITAIQIIPNTSLFEMQTVCEQHAFELWRWPQFGFSLAILIPRETNYYEIMPGIDRSGFIADKIPYKSTFKSNRSFSLYRITLDSVLDFTLPRFDRNNFLQSAHFVLIFVLWMAGCSNTQRSLAR